MPLLCELLMVSLQFLPVMMAPVFEIFVQQS